MSITDWMNGRPRARRAESNERCAPTGQGDRLAPAAFFLAIESDDAGAGSGDHGAGGGVTSSATGSSLRWPAVAHGADGPVPRLTQLISLTRTRGQWRIRRRRISISRLSDRRRVELLRGEVGGRCQSRPVSIDRGVEAPVNSIDWPHARARAVADSAAADF